MNNKESEQQFYNESICSKDYKCPNCGLWHNDDPDGYLVDDIVYPKVFDEFQSSDMDGPIWDWSEMHCCENCGTKFWFRNGAY